MIATLIFQTSAFAGADVKCSATIKEMSGKSFTASTQASDLRDACKKFTNDYEGREVTISDVSCEQIHETLSSCKD